MQRQRFSLLAMVFLDINLIVVLFKRICRMVMLQVNGIYGVIDIRRLGLQVMQRIIFVYPLNMTGVIS